MTLVWIVLLPFLAIVPVWIAGRHSRVASAGIAGLAALASLVLLIQDVMVFLEGGDSLIGRWLQKMDVAGGKSGEIGARPLTAEVEFLRASDGRFQLEDPESHLASMCGTLLRW